MAKINVNGSEITVIVEKENDYISLTEMVSNHIEGSKLIEKWLTTKSTIEFLGVWEQLYNPIFNSPEFGGIKTDAGSNAFFMSVKQWVERTNAIGIFAKVGRYGGTYAHKDIAFEFASYVSPMFKLLLIKEFQRLKEQESQNLHQGWNVRRFISRTNYRIQTDAVKVNLIPLRNLPKSKEGILYAEEAEVLNVAMFGITSKDWKAQNPALNGNIRDYADLHQLIVLSNLESLNAEMINRSMPQNTRLETLGRIAISQLKSLESSKEAIDRNIQSPNMTKPKHIEENTFDQNLKGLLAVPPPQKENK